MVLVKKIKDRIVLGLVSGLAGNVAKLAGNLANAYLFGFSRTTYPILAGQLFMNQKQLRTKTGLLVGTLADMVIGAAVGVPLVYMLTYTGKDHYALKGIGFGNTAWTGLFGAMSRLALNQAAFQDAPTNLSAFLNHTWYGLVASAVAANLGDPGLFGKKAVKTHFMAREPFRVGKPRPHRQHRAHPREQAYS